MKRRFIRSLHLLLIITVAITAGCKKDMQRAGATRGEEIIIRSAAVSQLGTATTPYKVAYYSFDHGGPRIQDFSPFANVVVLFEGTPFELADSVHYGSSSSYIKSGGSRYRSYISVINDAHALQAKGVKVLWNIDESSAWQTTKPFTNYAGTQLNATQYAALIKACVIDSLHMDGIALDVEHIQPYSTEPTANFLAVMRALGAQFGPASSNPSTILTSATGYNVAYGLHPLRDNADIAASFSFVIDQGYDVTNAYRVSTRLPPFSNIANFGWPKTMTGVNTEGNSNLAEDILSAQWQPSSSYKAGIMVYAANGDTAYAGKVFRAVTNGSDAATGVTFYQNASYGGTASQKLAKGNYTLSQLAAKGVPNDWASSVKVPAGWTVIMYSNDNFSGTSWTRTSDTPNFSTLSPSANDQVSSVKIQ